jgi:hypothetical protein
VRAAATPLNPPTIMLGRMQTHRQKLEKEIKRVLIAVSAALLLACVA